MVQQEPTSHIPYPYERPQADQMPKRIRKLPLTWKEDFFMEILEEPETGRTINSSDCKRNMNQDQAQKFFTPKYSKKSLAIYHQNIRGLSNSKLDELYIYIYLQILRISYV